MTEIDVDHADGGNNRRRRFGRPAMLLVTVFVAASSTALAIPLIRAASDPAPEPALPIAAPMPAASPVVPHPALPGVSFFCIESATKPHCERYVKDMTRRVHLDEAGQEAAQTALERMEAVMPPGRDGPCEYDEDYEVCSVEILPPTIRQVSHALDKAGYRTAVIRNLSRWMRPAGVKGLRVRAMVSGWSGRGSAG